VRYLLLLVRSDEEWESLTDEDRDYAAIDAWFAGLASSGRLAGGAELQAARTAMTVRWDRGTPVVLDGPYIESKEAIGGFAVVEVADLDEALAIAKSWPARGHAVEVRPVVPH
jgi:hypothetical protein